MKASDRRNRFKTAKAASAAVESHDGQKQFQEMFPELMVEHDAHNEILKSVQEVSSYSDSSSNDFSSEEEEKHLRGEPENQVKLPTKFRKSKVRKSILKSHLLTNKRQSRYSKSLSKGGFRKLNTEVEGRLPIRRPSNVEPIINTTPFSKQKNSGLAMLGKSKEELVNANKSEEKGELDYIGVEESGDREDLNSFLSRSLFTNKFQLVWAFMIFLAHTYHVFAMFWYLGISAYPEGALLSLQIFFEIFLIFDFILRLCLKTLNTDVWESIWLLHDYYAFSTVSGITKTVIGTIPFMLLISISTSDPNTLNTFWIACFRIPKLLRFREVNKISNNYSRSDKQNSSSYGSFLYAGYALLLATHIIGCIWLIVGRIDPEEYNWHDMDNFDQNPSNFQKYIESCFFTVATMTGLGYGNVVPTTDLEIFSILFIMVTGASIYANFFANFIVTMNKNNAKTIERIKKHDQAKNFGNQLNISEPIMLKIRYFYNELSLNYGDLHERYSNLKELPTSLSTELSIFLNSSLIKRIKLFQFSNPMFILSVARTMMPKLCMANDFVVEQGDIAEEVFFIKKGVVEVLATDGTTVIAYLSEGAYFGEIGVLLTGIRSVSVKAKTS